MKDTIKYAAGFGAAFLILACCIWAIVSGLFQAELCYYTCWGGKNIHSAWYYLMSGAGFMTLCLLLGCFAARAFRE